MSITIQNRLKERSKFGGILTPQHRLSQNAFDDQVYSDGFIISQMTLERELPGHTGCVNTLDWSLMGDKLLSGSDDTKLNIYLPFEGYNISTTIDTGHRANIFTAKFMPKTSDNVIISGAGDSEIRIFDLQNMDSPLFAMYVCHGDQVKKICVYDDNPYEFLTCSQDGTVRQFDLRIPHICSPHSVRSFLTAQHKPARQHPLPKGSNVQEGCPQSIIDYSKYNIELNSMTINKLFPHYFAVAGMNDYIYLHDRRMMQPANSPISSAIGGSNSSDMMDTLKCIKRFSPRLDGYSRPNKHITACKFSDSNGYELIGSWSSDAIYLFNINDSEVQLSSSSSISNPNKRVKRSHRSANQNESTSLTNMVTINDPEECIDIHALWEKVTHYYTSHDFSTALYYTNKLSNALETLNDTDNTNLGKACAYMIRASILTYQAYEENNSAESSTFSNAHDAEIRELIEKGESYAPQLWLGFWCKAIGYWLVAGGLYSNGHTLRRLYLDKSFYLATRAKAALFRETSSSSSSTSVNGSSVDSITSLHQCYRNMMSNFIYDLEILFLLEGFTRNTRNLTLVDFRSPGNENRYKWINFMDVNQLPSDIQELSMLVSMSRLLPGPPILSTSESPASEIDTSNNDSFSYTSSSSTASTGTTENEMHDDNEEEEPDEGDDQSLYNRIMSRQILDIYRRGDDDISDSEDFDLEALAILRENANHSSFETDVGVVKPRSKFTGHCNIETVKDVDFYGLHDEYIVSGSDKGHLFIWDKKTTKIVQILRADEDVVNVAKGHPFLPLLAVSGIDSTVKIFKPTSRLPLSSKKQEPNNPNSYSSSSQLYEREEIIEANRESNRSLGDDIYMTRSMYAAFLRMERQRRLLVTDGVISDENDETEVEED